MKKIVVLGVGGTIAGTAASATENIAYTSSKIGIQSLLQGLPKSFPGDFEWLAEQVVQVDSKDMDHSIWQLLVQRVHFWLLDASVQAIVITHGTDTLEETAYFLHAVLQPSKPVVLTCAMRPATSLLADGPQNILDAFSVACDAKAKGVMVVCAGVVHDPVAVQKVHTYRLDAFESGDAGALGRIRERHLSWIRNPFEVNAIKENLAIELVTSSDPQAWPWVAIVSSHAGADEALVEGLVAQGVNGLVVAGTGNGMVHHRLQEALHRAKEQGIQVWRTTRCQAGPVLIHTEDQGGQDFYVANGLNVYKARIALMLHLMQTPLN